MATPRRRRRTRQLLRRRRRRAPRRRRRRQTTTPGRAALRKGRSVSGCTLQRRGDARHAPSPRVLGACSGRRCATETCARKGVVNAAPPATRQAPTRATTRHVLERVVVYALRHRAQLGVVPRLRRAQQRVSAACVRASMRRAFAKASSAMALCNSRPILGGAWPAILRERRARLPSARAGCRPLTYRAPSVPARVAPRRGRPRLAAARTSPRRVGDHVVRRRRLRPGSPVCVRRRRRRRREAHRRGAAAAGDDERCVATPRHASGGAQLHVPRARVRAATLAPALTLPRAAADPSPRHVGRRLDALQRRHAFWETQPVVQFGEGDAAEARRDARKKRAAGRSPRAAAHAGARGPDRPAHDCGASAARAVPAACEARRPVYSATARARDRR